MTTKVLITGPAGFIGHHLVAYLLDNTDWEIICLDRLDVSGNLNRLSEILEERPLKKSRIRFVYHDLKSEINSIIESFIGPVDIILHLAAASHVDRSIANPMEFVMDNVVGTVNLLQFARRQDQLQRFVYFSTDEVFGPAPKSVAFKERDRYNSTNPYSASKAGGEEMCVAFHNTYGLPMMILHTMNVFGERQHPEKFIPMSIRKILLDEEIPIHADATLTEPGSRFYIHVQDVCSAVFYLLTQLDVDNIKYPNELVAKCPKFNIVGIDEIDNLILAKSIAASLDRPLRYQLVSYHSGRPGHDLRYALDGSLMASLGWQPKHSVEQWLPELVKWTVKNPLWLGIN
jgi:dTDP-glucose 4,6-dehydratase